ncbi:MAG: lipase maturation factor family protein [Thermodesulfobacteriota bacterium]
MLKNKPELPLLIYDGECGVCRLWVDYWKSLTGDRVRYASFQNVALDFPEIPPEHFKKFVVLITADGELYKGAEAVLRVLTYCPGKSWFLWLYMRIPGFSSISEAVYRLVASHRSFFYKVTMVLWGKNLGPYTFRMSRWVFLRALGIIYFVAFFSFFTQILGLIGSNGILPADIFLGSWKISLGWKAYAALPTLAWINYGDEFLRFIPICGMLLSLLLIAGLFTFPVLIGLWMLYLSLVNIGQDFMSFQWDVLLLETGFLAIFLAPLAVFERTTSEPSPSRIVLWLLRFLLFRLIFSSGIGKIMSGDPTWGDFTALAFHYYTQPLPTPIAWYTYQLPLWFQKVSVALMYFVEVVVPFFIFATRRLRFFAGIMIILLQVLILLTGNYTFFNMLTIALCILLFDDSFFRALFLSKFKSLTVSEKAYMKSRSGFSMKQLAVILIFVVMLALGCIQLGKVVVGYRSMPRVFQNVIRWVSPYRIVNSYGLFTVMTTSRPEIIIEGSNDGREWYEYEFKYKPGGLKKPLPWVAPLQPRLDWQMWFAALGSYQANPWFTNLMLQILEGSPEVLDLLDRNPFPESPPKYLRASVYEYNFTDSTTRRMTGNLWTRELKGLYLPVLSLEVN